MNKVHFKFLLSILIIFAISCSKEEDDNPVSKMDPKPIFDLKIGNYWVYQFVSRQKDGTTLLSDIDTLKVLGDTILDGYNYFNLYTEKPSKGNWFLRDSSGYIVNHLGSIFLAPSSSQTIYNKHFNFLPNGPQDTLFVAWDVFPAKVQYEYMSESYDALLQTTVHKKGSSFGGNSIIDSSIYSEIGPMQRSYSYFTSETKLIGRLIDHHLVE